MPATATTTPFDRAFAFGDLVTVSPMAGGRFDPTKVYKITKVPAASNQVNYVASPVDGKGQGVRGRAYSFLPYDGEVPEAPAVPATPDLPPLALGAMVLAKPGRNPGMKQRCPYVVLDIRPDGTLKLAELGGCLNADGHSTFWTKIRRDSVTELDYAELFNL